MSAAPSRHSPDEGYYPKWIDSFPHTFHGWGPNTPDEDAGQVADALHGDGEATRSVQVSGIDNLPEAWTPLLFCSQHFNAFASTLIWTSKR